jgi:3-dehydroquinate synthase
LAIGQTEFILDGLREIIMQSITRFSAVFMLLLVTMMLVIVGTFTLFEQQSSQWISTVAAQLESSGGVWLLALFLIAVLACDIVLPVPSSIVAVFAATTLGFWGGAGVIWLGLMLSCCFGYLIGSGSGYSMLQRCASLDDLAKAQALADKMGPGTLVALRGVPVLAETSVIAAGMIRFPLPSFLLICALTNVGLAAAYAYVGAQAGAKGSFLLVILGSIALPAGAWLLKWTWQQFTQTRSMTASDVNPLAPIHRIDANFNVSHHYPVLFENQVFDSANPVLRDLLNQDRQAYQKVFIYLDAGVDKNNPQLCQKICAYFQHHRAVLDLVASPQIIAGGEAAKQDDQVKKMYQQMLHHQLDRHSCVLAIGGGAVLDAVGFACATFHRGVKLLRLPSTVLAQNDAGVGVKNGFNFSNTKNLIGTFAPPVAVLNDSSLLQSLSARDRRAGLAEAVKVAAIRDETFFAWIEAHADALSCFEDQASQYAIARCAQLHLNQITRAGDPFESGSARPLDYGHWSAHKLESIAKYSIRHGEAVAIGMALDTRYAVNIGILSECHGDRLVNLLEKLGFDLWHDGLDILDTQDQPLVFSGLEEFRQHLGGELCVTLLSEIGISKEVNVIDQQQLINALDWLKQRANGVQQTQTEPPYSIVQRSR